MPTDKSGHFYFSWFPTIIQADTAHLSLAEDGAYRRLIDYYMTTKAPLPDNDAALARIVGIGRDEWDVIKGSVKPYFKSGGLNGALLLHSFCEQELSIHHARINKASENGKKGGRPKLMNKEENKAVANLDQTQQKAKHNITEHKKEVSVDKSTSPPLVKKSYPDDFENFWKGYTPFEMSRGEKHDALQAYNKARKEIDHETIIAARDRYLAKCRASETKTRHASTWLNKRGWAGEPDDGSTGSNQSGHRSSGSGGSFAAETERVKAKIIAGDSGNQTRSPASPEKNLSIEHRGENLVSGSTRPMLFDAASIRQEDR